VTTDLHDEDAWLQSYDLRAFPPVAVAVDLPLLTVRSGRLCVLLVRRADHPEKGKWAMPGGFLNPDESADMAAVRELHEETGLGVDPWHVEQLGTYTRPDRDPRGPRAKCPDGRVISIAYLVFSPQGREPTAGSDAADARWWAVDDLDLTATSGQGPELAFDHGEIISDAVERCRSKLEYTTLAATFLDEPFNLGSLRRVYEAVWGVRLHHSNFARKVTSSPGFLVPTEVAGNRQVLYRRGPAMYMAPPLSRPEKDEEQ
jgi:8-oxo-dGTP diphosphatase